MKMTLEWHKRALANRKTHLLREQEQLNRMIARVKKSKTEVAFHELQIQEAERQKKDGFDEDKFLKARKPK